MVTKLQQFCKCQIYARGDVISAIACDPNDPEAQLFCGAHLHERRAFPCPYNTENIAEEWGKPTIAFIREGRRTGYCEYFKPLAQSQPLCIERQPEFGNGASGEQGQAD